MNEFGNFLNSDISDELQQHSIRLFTIYQAFSLLKYCMESDFYEKTPTEFYSFGLVLKEYIKSTGKKFNKIQDDLGIPR